MQQDSRVPAPEPVLLREADVCRRYGISKSWLRQLISYGILPRPLKFGLRMSRWRVDQIDAAFSASDLSERIAAHTERRRAERKLHAARKAGA